MADRSFNYEIILELVNKTGEQFKSMSNNIDQLNNKLNASGHSSSGFTKGTNESSSSLEKFAGNILTTGAKFGLFMMAVQQVAGSLISLAEQLGEDDLAMQRLKTTVELQGKNWTVYNEKIQDVLESIIRTSKYTDKDLIPAFNKLAIMTGSVDKALENMQLVVDMTATGMFSMEQASGLIGQALEGNFTMLGRYIPEVKDLAEKYKDATDKTELVTEATSLLQSKFKGMAEGELNTLIGQLGKMGGNVGELIEAIGGSTGLTDTLQIWATGTNALIEGITNLITTGSVHKKGIEDLGAEYSEFSILADGTRLTQEGLNKAFKDATESAGLLDGEVQGLSFSTDDLDRTSGSAGSSFLSLDGILNTFTGSASTGMSSMIGLGDSVKKTVQTITEETPKIKESMELWAFEFEVLNTQNKDLINFYSTDWGASQWLSRITAQQEWLSKKTEQSSKTTLKSIDEMKESLKDWADSSEWGNIAQKARYYFAIIGVYGKQMLDTLVGIYQTQEDIQMANLQKEVANNIKAKDIEYETNVRSAEDNYILEKDKILVSTETEEQKQKDLALLENKYNAEKLARERAYDDQVTSEKKRLEDQEKMAYDRMKGWKKSQTIINMATSIMQVWADATMPIWAKVPMTAMLAVQGKLNLDLIDAQEFATGVRNFGGGLAIVGEKGAELVNLPSGSDVYTHEESMRMIGGSSGGNITVNVSGNYIMNDRDADRLADIVSGGIMRRLKKEVYV